MSVNKWVDRIFRTNRKLADFQLKRDLKVDLLVNKRLVVAYGSVLCETSLYSYSITGRLVVCVYLFFMNH